MPRKLRVVYEGVIYLGMNWGGRREPKRCDVVVDSPEIGDGKLAHGVERCSENSN